MIIINKMSDRMIDKLFEDKKRCCTDVSGNTYDKKEKYHAKVLVCRSLESHLQAGSPISPFLMYHSAVSVFWLTPLVGSQGPVSGMPLLPSVYQFSAFESSLTYLVLEPSRPSAAQSPIGCLFPTVSLPGKIR